MDPPTRQSDATSAPNMYCLIAAGSTSACHTRARGASIVVIAPAISPFPMAPSSREIHVHSAGKGNGGNVDRYCDETPWLERGPERPAVPPTWASVAG